MAKRTDGNNSRSKLVPESTDSGYGIVNAVDATGGAHHYATLEERDAIKPGLLVLGMLCTVGSTSNYITYRLEVILGPAGWKDIMHTVNGRVTILEDRATVLENRATALEADLEGAQIGDSFVLPTHADLINPANPSGETNATGITRYGSVYADPDPTKNGRYYQPIGSLSWTKVAGDVTGRVASLEAFQTGAAALLPVVESHTTLLNVWLDANRRVIMEHRTDGKTFLRLADDAIPMVPLSRLASDVTALFPAVGDYQGIIWALNDPNFRPLLYFKDSGKAVLRLEDGTVTGPMLVDATVTATKLGTDIQSVLPVIGAYEGILWVLLDPTLRPLLYFKDSGKAVLRLEDNSITAPMIADAAVNRTKLGEDVQLPLIGNYAGIIWVLLDPNFRPLLYFKDNGKAVLRLDDGSVTGPMLANGSVSASKLALDSDYLFPAVGDYTDVIWLLKDPTGRPLLYFKNNGDAVLRLAPGSFADGAVTTSKLAAESVSRPKLDKAMNRDTSNNLPAVMTDGVRTNPPPTIGVKTLQNWAPLPDRMTPVLFGINTTGTTLEFRRSNRLLIKGHRRVGTFDPGPVPSVNYRGFFIDTTTWPPTGTFAAQDYYQYASNTNRTIGADLLRFGDLMVYDGSAWLFKACPGTGTSRLEWDWWQITVAGYFDGIALAVGDKLVCLGKEVTGGSRYFRWRRGEPAWGEFFRMGEFDPAAGLPASPYDGELWEASAAGTAGGFTFAVGDTLIRHGGVWGNIVEEPIKSFAAGAVIHLPCHQSSFEWVLRKASKSAQQSGLILNCYGNRKYMQPGSGITCTGDSMTYFAGLMAPHMPGRTITNRTHASSTAKEMRTLAEHLIYNGDPDENNVIVICTGQNNISDFAQTQEAAEAMINLCGTASRRILFVIPLGVFQDIVHNGTRFVIDNFECQIPPFLNTSTNIYARTYRYFRDSHPDNWISYRDAVAAAVAASPTANDANLQFPGMTNLQVVNAYGILPWSWMTNVIGMDGVNPNLLNYVGLWNSAGLPDGGSPNDYYLRNGPTSEDRANPIINKGGVWTEIFYSVVHLGDEASEAMAAAVAAWLNARNW